MPKPPFPRLLTASLLLWMVSCSQPPQPEAPTVQTFPLVRPAVKGLVLAPATGVPRVSKDLRPASPAIPGALAPDKTPQFVVLGFDDNGVSENIDWIVEELAARKNSDGSPAMASFYMMGTHGVAMVSWKKALDAGHEVGNHSFNHPHGLVFDGGADRKTVLPTLTVEGWRAETEACFIALEKLSIPRSQVRGFRQPYLEYSDASLSAAAFEGFAYDCSVEEGFAADQDGTNFVWPYTLDQGSPGDAAAVAAGRPPIGTYPGLWELPVYALQIPGLAEAQRYGLIDAKGDPYDLYAKFRALDPGLTQPKVTGFDYNLWSLYQATGPEFTAILKYNLDLRLAGNRAPFTFGAHSDDYPATEAGEVRRKALLEFLDYAVSLPGVMVRRADRVLDWVKDPRSL